MYGRVFYTNSNTILNHIWKLFVHLNKIKLLESNPIDYGVVICYVKMEILFREEKVEELCAYHLFSKSFLTILLLQCFGKTLLK